MSEESSHTDAAERTSIVLVTGSGRSGTSTVAGTLQRLGLHVPQPEVPADETNPRGFYEPQWVVDFHKEVLATVPVRTIDARPEAAGLAAEAGREPEFRARLVEWLGGQLAQPQLVIKDPRAFWVHDLWRDVSAELGAELTFLTMLRHPVEVAQSRDSAYLNDHSDEFRLQRETGNIAAWCNAAFETELATRANRRAFVRYVDLMSDWRDAMARAGRQLGVSYNADLTTRDHHAVDDFIDAGLRRSTRTWDDVAVPEELKRHAEAVWQAMNTLVEDPADSTATEALSELQAQYVAYHSQAEAVSMDSANARVAAARRETRAALNEKHERRVKKLKERNQRLRDKVRRLERSEPVAHSTPLTQLPRKVARKLKSVRRG